MTHEELMSSNRWQVRFSYTCTCEPTCYYAKDGRHTTTTYLNGGEQELEPEAIAAHLTCTTRQGVEILEVWQEGDEERDARLARRRRAAADERRGVWWGMGGAN
ncbi:hypothetical protein [Streptomyces filamentosus]|uniref:hypothetical protein n=1 Tax=Streptomyces filamentosus TaxID=67294 RepID=UPI0033CFA88F